MMKKLLFTVLIVLGANFLNAQIFKEDFENLMPSTFTIIDNDGGTPATNVNWCTDAWVVRADFEFTTDNVAASVSWYSPAGTSDDYMITPAITIPSGTAPSLIWNVKAQDGSYADGYEVIISTTGNTLADMQAGSIIYSTTGALAVWTTESKDLTSYAGQTIYIGYRNNSNDKFVLLVDDIIVSELPDNEIELTTLTLSKYHEGGKNVEITGTVTNYGANALTSFDVEWTDGTTTKSQTISGINVGYGVSYNFTHSDYLALASGYSQSSLTVTVSSPNAGTDDDITNNSLMSDVYGLTEIPEKHVVFEEKTGTWCGWCPRGTVGMDAITSAHPGKALGIAVHNGDPMAVTEYDSNIGNYVPGGYPGGGADRVVSLDPNEQELESVYQERSAIVVPLSVSADYTYDGSSETYTVNVTADVKAPMSGDYRLNIIVIEDHVTGTASGYDQVNYYSGNGNGAMGGFESLADPVPAADMEYNHVARALIAGMDGEAGSLPATMAANSTHNHTFTFTLPSGSDFYNTHLIATVHDQTTGEIMNGSMATGEAVGVNELTNENGFYIFPNPSNGTTNVNITNLNNEVITFKVLDLLGKVLSSGNSTSDKIVFNTLNWNSGIYFVEVTIGTNKHLEKLTVK